MVKPFVLPEAPPFPPQQSCRLVSCPALELFQAVLAGDVARVTAFLDEVADVNAARAHALDEARVMIARTRTDMVRDWMVCAFEIVDEDGRAVLTVPFSDTVPEDELG